MNMLANSDNCRSDLLFAYIEGDLDPAEISALEQHLSECKACDHELRMQRLFMCELDSVLATESELSVPPDFAHIVAAKAESDMSGARSRVEHRRALQFCIVLAVASFILLGTTTSESILTSLRRIISKSVGVVELIGKALYDAGVGLTVMLRATGRAFSPDSLSVLVFLFLLLAVLLLSLLISSFHRYHRGSLFE
jgi:predicted anti-sigma-YlaC factor YlaD